MLSNNYVAFFHLSYSGNLIDHHLPVTLHHVTLFIQSVALNLKMIHICSKAGMQNKNRSMWPKARKVAMFSISSYNSRPI